MEPFTIMIMEKNKESELLEKEVGSYTISQYGNLIHNIYMMGKEEKSIVYMKITTDKDVEDWEFSAILDYYDEEVLKEIVLSCREVEDTYNPVWEVTFEFVPSQEGMQKKLEEILTIHKQELDEVYAEIKEKQEEYK